MKSTKERLLKVRIVKALLFLVAFFSLVINVNAASFSYSAFEWDKFYKENVNYWTDYCKSYAKQMSEGECLDVVLSGKKDFYESLYTLLAKYESNKQKSYRLDDNIILVTTFFDLTPDTFSDLPDEYLKAYGNGSAYNLDDDFESYDINSDLYTYSSAGEYLEDEADMLKTLTKHMFSYPTKCEGVIGTTELDENGNKICRQGTKDGDNCKGTIDTFDLNYSEYLINKWSKITKDTISVVGIKNEKGKECNELGGTLAFSEEKQINYDIYWEFLIESNYFDNKVHLTSRYQTILDKTNHKLMKELTKSEREQYADDIKKVRERIVSEIKSIYDTYGVENYAIPASQYTSAGCTNSSAWWPIGSDDVTLENGIEIAKGDPVSTYVSSPFGMRIHPITGKRKQHTGIDIAQVTEGVTNVIAVKDGVVVYPTSGSPTNCPSSRSLDSCGGGYGNYVIIQHNDGTYTLYAHLYSDSITVTANDSVKQGQVIGKIGSSGNSTGPHLHFEIRQGSNSSSATIDPLSVISDENPRAGGGGICSGSSSEFIKMLHWFEGSCASPTNGTNYVIHNDGYGYPTVGYGVALFSNVDRFKNYGIDVSNMSIGQELPIDIVENVKNEEINSFRTYVNNYLAKNSITLAEYQLDALTMISYQFGNLGNFGTTYQQYGNTESLRQYTHNQKGTWYYFKENPSTANGRADATWKLFNEGVYTYDESKC